MICREGRCSSGSRRCARAGTFREPRGLLAFRRDFLRGHVLLELARKEVHNYNLVSGGAGGIGVGLRFPRMRVGVVNDHQINAICEQSSVDFPTCAENRLSYRLFYLEEREDDKTTEGNGSGDTRLDSFAERKSSVEPENDYRGILCRVRENNLRSNRKTHNFNSYT